MQDFFNKIECKTKQNTNFLSYLRLFATFVVIFNHVLINTKNDFGGIQFGSIEYFNHYVTYVMFMMTGYSYMKMKQHITIRMSILMVFKYFIAMMLFSLPFCFMELLYKANYVFDVNIIYNSIYNALWGRTWDHLWYIYVLLLIYLLLPLLSRIYKSENNLLLPYFTLILFLSCVFNTEIRINSKIYMFSLIPFNYIMFAVTFGAFAYRYKMFNKLNSLILCGLLIIISLVWWFNIRLLNGRAIIVMVSMMLFLVFEKIFIWKSKVINYLSTYTFIIYIMHVIFLHLLTKVLRINPYAFGGYIGIILFTILLYIITLVCSMMIKKIPFIKSLYF